jgi:hypothetical protein
VTVERLAPLFLPHTYREQTEDEETDRQEFADQFALAELSIGASRIVSPD